MGHLPLYLSNCFWDVKFEDLDLNQDARFIIERILEYGDQKAAKWMRNNYKQQQIEKVIKNSHKLSQKSAGFWTLIYNLDKNQVLCLKPSFRNKHRVIWKH